MASSLRSLFRGIVYGSANTANNQNAQRILWEENQTPVVPPPSDDDDTANEQRERVGRNRDQIEAMKARAAAETGLQKEAAVMAAAVHPMQLEPHSKLPKEEKEECCICFCAEAECAPIFESGTPHVKNVLCKDCAATFQIRNLMESDILDERRHRYSKCPVTRKPLQKIVDRNCNGYIPEPNGKDCMTNLTQLDKSKAWLNCHGEKCFGKHAPLQLCKKGTQLYNDRLARSRGWNWICDSCNGSFDRFVERYLHDSGCNYEICKQCYECHSEIVLRFS